MKSISIHKRNMITFNVGDLNFEHNFLVMTSNTCQQSRRRIVKFHIYRPTEVNGIICTNMYAFVQSPCKLGSQSDTMAITFTNKIETSV